MNKQQALKAISAKAASIEQAADAKRAERLEAVRRAEAIGAELSALGSRRLSLKGLEEKVRAVGALKRCRADFGRLSEAHLRALQLGKHEELSEFEPRLVQAGSGWTRGYWLTPLGNAFAMATKAGGIDPFIAAVEAEVEAEIAALEEG